MLLEPGLTFDTELHGVEVNIQLDKEERPQLFKARQVPFVMRQVEEELQHLQSLGMIQPVQFSDWADPIMPVVKKDGRVRICGEFKVTINEGKKFDNYPIPRIEELFPSLARGKAFTRLDLLCAYLQILLDEESCHYVTINTHRGLFEYKSFPSEWSLPPQSFSESWRTCCKGSVECMSTLTTF